MLLVKILHLLFLEKTATFAKILRTASCIVNLRITQFQLKTVLHIFFRTNSSKDSRYSIFRKSFFTFLRNIFLVKSLHVGMFLLYNLFQNCHVWLYLFLNDSLFPNLQEYNQFHIYENYQTTMVAQICLYFVNFHLVFLFCATITKFWK